MPDQLGLRDRKKLQTRQRIADVAAVLIAERGYDAVSMVDVARAAEVSDQTVYNYFAAKQELVLDMAEQIRGWYDQAIRGRSEDVTPAEALAPLLLADIDRYRHSDLTQARGEFMAQSVTSATLRRFTLEERERQTLTIAAAVRDTAPGLPAVVAHTHAAALVAAIAHVHDLIGHSVLDRAPQDMAAERIRAVARIALTDLSRAFAGRGSAPTPH
ncbi:TetR family transcriptional regulator [Modestobacter sp. I12A-02628]|uniref:TetR/AcrR family transcriptional regulator n=1 Tax=Goekera deserti TaxID=2497753 RepID=A0A7K3WHU8_9ACTN|nr:TetR/AcrR family transcriptional regulator [Goekera deserti]MPQ99081.1 TetR family transcriptional regulator [Goekera deserti]NDI47415.1 TetR family transcriptional regulator [Goekera deserti]NEL55946.1 TetR/AcrR family transcriptional regulator [Goekera deserti]